MRDADTKRDSSGRFKVQKRCDACSRPIHGSHYTDDEVCAGGDGPGFYLCGRKRCIAKRSSLPDGELRKLYAAARAWNDQLEKLNTNTSKAG